MEETAWLGGDCYRLPVIAQEFIAAFDSGRPVDPIEFDLTDEDSRRAGDGDMRMKLWRVLHWRMERRMVRELYRQHRAVLELTTHDK